MIPEAAVEAAIKAFSPLSDGFAYVIWDNMTAALDAAAPHMKRLVTTLAELDALPEGSIVRTESYSLYVKDQIRVGPTSWWVTTNERHDFRSADIELPVMVLHEP